MQPCAISAPYKPRRCSSRSSSLDDVSAELIGLDRRGRGDLSTMSCPARALEEGRAAYAPLIALAKLCAIRLPRHGKRLRERRRGCESAASACPFCPFLLDQVVGFGPRGRARRDGSSCAILCVVQRLPVVLCRRRACGRRSGPAARRPGGAPPLRVGFRLVLGLRASSLISL